MSCNIVFYLTSVTKMSVIITRNLLVIIVTNYETTSTDQDLDTAQLYQPTHGPTKKVTTTHRTLDIGGPGHRHGPSPGDRFIPGLCHWTNWDFFLTFYGLKRVCGLL